MSQKSGVVVLMGRPNVGKSTLLNNLLQTKVSITSPKPQTTRFSIEAIYQDERGQIIFVDSPGIFGKAKDNLSKKININAQETASRICDAVVYIIDHTRRRDYEENKTLGIVRKLKIPKILVINKTDIKKPSYREEYVFLEEEFDRIIEISALKRTNLNALLNEIFTLLPEGKITIDKNDLPIPALNVNSKTFIAELIREKAFLVLRKEVPYTVTAKVDEISERANGVLYIKARIITTDDRYKKMIIGSEGRTVKEISMQTRKELEVSSGKKIYLELLVDVDPHWIDNLS